MLISIIRTMELTNKELKEINLKLHKRINELEATMQRLYKKIRELKKE